MFRRKKTDYLSSITQPVTSQSTIIAFDLHNVVFKKQTRKIVMHGLKLLPKGTWRYTFNPRLWYRFYKIKKSSNVAEEIFQKMSTKYPGLSRFRGDFIMMTNHQKPIRSTVDLIIKLKTLGYSLYILSNIGDETFDKLCERYPLLNACFDGAFTARADANYVQKPQHEFYESFKSYVAQEGHTGKQILFIDDLRKNLAAAASCAIGGIHFTSAKRLIRAFKKLNIIT